MFFGLKWGLQFLNKILDKFATYFLVAIAITPFAIPPLLIVAKSVVSFSAFAVWMYFAAIGLVPESDTPFPLIEHWLDVTYLNQAELMYMGTMNHLFF